jgi:hypothetical protein
MLGDPIHTRHQTGVYDLASLNQTQRLAAQLLIELVNVFSGLVGLKLLPSPLRKVPYGPAPTAGQSTKHLHYSFAEQGCQRFLLRALPSILFSHGVTS